MKYVTFKKAFKQTIPVMAGYICLSTAFSLLMKNSGHPYWYPIVMSIVIFSGALQFATVPLLRIYDPIGSFIIGLMLSARHLFYGISMLKRYARTGKLKWSLAHLLTDETFSIISTVDVPDDVDETLFYFFISFLNYSYWIIGTIIGVIFGSFITADIQGLDFTLTALFIVMFVEQFSSVKGARSSLIGLVSSILALILFKDNMVLVSMALIFVILFVFRKVIDHD